MRHYVIRVDGVPPPSAVEAFPALKVSPQQPQTLLHGPLPDQSALAGVLELLKRSSIAIIEVISLPVEDPAGPIVELDEAELPGNPECS